MKASSFKRHLFSKLSFFFFGLVCLTAFDQSLLKHTKSSGHSNLGSLAQPTLEDLFNGTARFQDLHESQEVKLQFNDNLLGVWDQKLPIVFNPQDGFYYAWTRGYFKKDVFNIYLLKSTDGVNFTQSGSAVFSHMMDDWTLYDPHIAMDSSQSPPRYIMTMECAKIKGSGTFGASLCVSETTTPWVSSTWSQPRLVIQNDATKSASTGVTLADAGQYFISWTMVDDGLNMHDEGFESTSTWALQIPNLTTYMGKSGSVGKLMLGAERNIHCNSSWECNNTDLQDWKKIGNHYYAIYNGANYFRCTREDQASGTSEWKLAIRRSQSVLGPYDETTGPLISSELNFTCGISYPVINQMQDGIYMYYASYMKAGGNKTFRSKLVWGAGRKSSIVPLPQSPIFGTVDQLIKRYYQHLLGRPAAEAEVLDWMERVRNERLTGRRLAEGFLSSKEFLNRFQQMNPQQKVSTLYLGLLGREPDPQGNADFLGRIARGDSNQKLFEAFLLAPEFQTASVRDGGLP